MSLNIRLSSLRTGVTVTGPVVHGYSNNDQKAVRLSLLAHRRDGPAERGVLCGAAASGHFTWTPENIAKSLLCMTMSGPLLTGMDPQPRVVPCSSSSSSSSSFSSC